MQDGHCMHEKQVPLIASRNFCLTMAVQKSVEFYEQGPHNIFHGSNPFFGLDSAVWPSGVAFDASHPLVGWRGISLP